MQKARRFTGCLLAWILLAGTVGLTAGTAESTIRGINHRGYNRIAPENTLPAYELSKEKGFSYVETDVSFTKDGVPVLLHDSTINRTARNTDGSIIRKTVNINSITYEEALAYDFGIWKGEEYKGTKIPTLSEFLKLCRRLGLHPYIELKANGNYTREHIHGLVDLAAEEEMTGKVTWISFDYSYLEWVRERDPNARLGLLGTFWLTTIDFARNVRDAKKLQTGTNEVFLDVNYITLELVPGGGRKACVNLCREAGIPLEVWTVDDELIIRNLDPYITGVTSNHLRFELYRTEQ